MALTNLQKNKALEYLGFPLKVLDDTSEFYSPIIISRLTNLLPDSETVIADVISKLDDVYSKIVDSQTRMLALGVDNIKINPDEFKLLQRARSFWVRKLSQTTSLPVAEAIEGGGSVGVVVNV